MGELATKGAKLKKNHLNLQFGNDYDQKAKNPTNRAKPNQKQGLHRGQEQPTQGGKTSKKYELIELDAELGATNRNRNANKSIKASKKKSNKKLK